MRIIVSDTGPLIALAKSGYLPLLKELFQEVFIPPAVLLELRIDDNRAGSHLLNRIIREEKWITLKEISPAESVLHLALDPGETEAIILARAMKTLLLIDEARGRRAAKKLGLEFIGTGRILIAAKEKGLIPSVSAALDELSLSGYRLSASLQTRLRELAGEPA